MLIAYHSRTSEGWQEVCRHPIDSDAWSLADQIWIKEMLSAGQMVLTVGWNMWNVVKEEK